MKLSTRQRRAIWSAELRLKACEKAGTHRTSRIRREPVYRNLGGEMVMMEACAGCGVLFPSTDAI